MYPDELLLRAFETVGYDECIRILNNLKSIPDQQVANALTLERETGEKVLPVVAEEPRKKTK